MIELISVALLALIVYLGRSLLTSSQQRKLEAIKIESEQKRRPRR